MSEPMRYLLFVSIAIFSYMWITKRFWDSFLVRKKASFASILPWILLCASQFVSQSVQYGGFSLSPTLINTLVILIVAIFSYEPTGLETYFLFAFFCIMWGLIEITLASLFSFLKIGYQSSKPLGTVASLILMMAFTHVVSLLPNKKERASIPNRLAFALLLVPVGSIYIMLVQFYMVDSYFLSISVFIFLLLFNMIIFDVYTRLSQYFLREKENAVHAEQLFMISQNMEEQKKLMEEFYEEKHDLINELTALRGSISQDSNEEAVRNLDKILDCYHGMGNISSSGNSTVDAIINAKYAAAKEYGISFHLQICVPEELAIAPRDLGVVIGNALDNAIIAVRECASAEKTIRISMGVKKNALIMVMKNPYEHTLRRNRSGEFISTKPENDRHGYGIRSIRRIAKAYNGDVIIDANNGLFVLTVVLNFREF